MNKIPASPCYIAGPMKGVEHCNFPEFDRARDVLRGMGVKEVISPADLDRRGGFDAMASDEEPSREFVEEAFIRDVEWLFDCNSIVMLDGWESSLLGTAERNIAIRFGKEVWNLSDIEW